MASCEKGRCSAYSEDIRWRIVWQREALDSSIGKIAKNLCVDESTVRRVLAIFYASGNISKMSYPTERAFRKLTIPVQLFIMQLVVHNPGVFLHEIQSQLQDTLLVDVNISTIIMSISA